MIGIGITSEGIEHNPAVYELMAEMRWHSEEEVDVELWMRDWADRRMGPRAPVHRTALARNGWSLIAGSAYSCPTQQMGQPKSMIESRPRLDLFTGFIRNSDFMPVRRHYNESVLISAWHAMCTALDGPHDDYTPSRAALYDIADVTRQVLADLFSRLYVNYVGFVQSTVRYSSGYKHLHTTLPAGRIRTKEDATARARLMLDIILDLDRLLGTQEGSLLGKWITSARRWGADEKEADLFEHNARNLITMWGPRGEINDYASKQWSGLLKGYYFHRWKLFFDNLQKAMDAGEEFDETSTTDREIFSLESAWQLQKTPKFPDSPEGGLGGAVHACAHADDRWAPAGPQAHHHSRVLSSCAGRICSQEGICSQPILLFCEI